MNIRRQYYKKYRLEGMSKYRAAIKAGFSHATAWNATKNIENHCDMEKELRKAGLTNDELIRITKEGLLATKVIGYIHQYKQKLEEEGKVGDIEKITPEEIVSNEFLDAPDFLVRHKYLETILKILKIIKTGSETKVGVGVNVHNNGYHKLNGSDRKHQDDMLTFLENGNTKREVPV